MIKIEHIIKDELGLHARPAGKLVKQFAGFAGTAQIGTESKMVDAKRIMGVMGLALKHGDNIIITIDGDGEEALAKELELFLKENL